MFFGVALSLSLLYIYILDILCECVTWFFPWGSLFSTKFLPRNRRNRSWQAKASQARGTWRRIGSVHLAELGCSRNGVSSGTPKWWWTIPFKWMIWGYLTSETSKWRFQNGVYSWKKERLLVIVDFQVPGLIGKCHMLACIAGLLAKFQCLVRWMSTLQRQILSNPHLELSINGGTLYNIYIYIHYIYIYIYICFISSFIPLQPQTAPKIRTSPPSIMATGSLSYDDRAAGGTTSLHD